MPESLLPLPWKPKLMPGSGVVGAAGVGAELLCRIVVWLPEVTGLLLVVVPGEPWTELTPVVGGGGFGWWPPLPPGLAAATGALTAISTDSVAAAAAKTRRCRLYPETCLLVIESPIPHVRSRPS